MIPRLAMLRGYQRPWLRGDVLAGVTVAAYLVPQVMAYATVAGLPPVVGLWAALPALVVYALLGSSPSLSMGPEATTALVAIGLSVADLLVRVARPHDAIQGLVPGLAGMHDVDDYPQAETIPGLVVYRYDAPLCFANADDFRRRALAAADQQPGPLCWFVLNVEANVEVDFTALEAMGAIREELTRRGAVFALARVKQDLLARLQAFGLADKIGPGRLYPTLPTAVDAYRQWARDHESGPTS